MDLFYLSRLFQALDALGPKFLFVLQVAQLQPHCAGIFYDQLIRTRFAPFGLILCAGLRWRFAMSWR